MVDEAARAVTFLYKFNKGVANDSYGLHCAQAAGLPSSVVLRAEERKHDLECAGGGLKVSLSLYFSLSL
jgi:DNA mismatch repair ATPase MutS